MADRREARALRIAVLGAGRHSWFDHGAALRSYKRSHPGAVELVAVCDPNRDAAERYAKEFGFQAAHEQPEVMLDTEQLDGVVVIPPVGGRGDVVDRLLERRLPILWELPRGASWRAAERLVCVAEKHRAPNMISFNRRFNPAMVEARQWLSENTAGRPVQCLCIRTFRSNRPDPGSWRRIALHAADAAQAFLGAPVVVNTHKVDFPSRPVSLFDAQILYESGGTAQIVVAPDVGQSAETYELLGQGYCIHVNVVTCATQVFDERQLVLSWEAPVESEPVFRGGALGETVAFLGGLRRKEALRPDLRDAVSAMKVVEAIFAGGRVEVGP